jgi:hypothetical protein
MNNEQVAARVIRGLLTMRGAAAKLHTASVERQDRDVRAALHVIDHEYFSLRDYLNRVVEQTEEGAD